MYVRSQAHGNPLPKMSSNNEEQAIPNFSKKILADFLLSLLDMEITN